MLTAVKPSQLMVKIVHDELTQLMGGETAEIDLEGKPAVILMSDRHLSPQRPLYAPDRKDNRIYQ